MNRFRLQKGVIKYIKQYIPKKRCQWSTWCDTGVPMPSMKHCPSYSYLSHSIGLEGSEPFTWYHSGAKISTENHCSLWHRRIWKNLVIRWSKRRISKKSLPNVLHGIVVCNYLAAQQIRLEQSFPQQSGRGRQQFADGSKIDGGGAHGSQLRICVPNVVCSSATRRYFQKLVDMGGRVGDLR